MNHLHSQDVLPRQRTFRCSWRAKDPSAASPSDSSTSFSTMPTARCVWAISAVTSGTEACSSMKSPIRDQVSEPSGRPCPPWTS